MTHDGRAEWIAEALARYETPLLRFATTLLRDGDRARDIVQETFLQLCQQQRAAVEGHLAAWLFCVCRNRALDLRRKETRMETLTDIAAAEPPTGPSELLQHREDTGQIMKILATLTENQREVVHLRFQSGLSYKEIAEVTGHTVSNVGVLLHTAVAAIRAQLGRAPARNAGGSR
jgi:RNA polymerase sigma factor (sigma-70 family)